ncbi:zn-dependent glyoxylase [Lichtheimia corymbifera JMRC:FSU:9682]|uniref:Zn-dependent glyoxylase n=1 Tax=Lichtheimia corymbifera JMRC:FSU:9682 TaxID=1263082 RepID=A0A068RYT4_9FUNG|nr:zn-dependent glyoxylase [Lichtheimia corymbifera JMRC:FSU:9682]
MDIPLDSPPPAPNDKCYKLTCRANEWFERHQYHEAITEYTKVIQQLTLTDANQQAFGALVYCNRSASYLHMRQYHAARDDAGRAIELRSSWGKGYYRHAEALMKLRQYDNAIYYYKQALERDPENGEISARIARALLEKDNDTMGIDIIQVMPGRDIATQRSFHKPIQNRIYEFAEVMRNIIYIVADKATKQCVVVDACWDIDGIFRIVEEYGYDIVASVVTHYHFDHVGGSPPPPYDTLPIKINGLATLLKRLPHIKAYVHPEDIQYIRQANPTIPANRLAATMAAATETLDIGSKTHIRFIPTPGHTPGSQALLVNDCRLIAGDTLLCGFCGRTDLEGGDRRAMEQTLRYTLGQLDDRVVVYPGHHYGSDWSTIGIERDKGCLGDDLVGYGTDHIHPQPFPAAITGGPRSRASTLSNY